MITAEVAICDSVLIDLQRFCNLDRKCSMFLFFDVQALFRRLFQAENVDQDFYFVLFWGFFVHFRPDSSFISNGSLFNIVHIYTLTNVHWRLWCPL